MRNTTKLKIILLKYTVSFDRNEDDIFIMTLISKVNGIGVELKAKTYSTIISIAYSYMLKELKKEDGKYKVSPNQ